MNKLIKEISQKSNEDLCLLVMKLKLQLLEGRFAAANGEMEKTHKNKEIRKTIAQALTILKSRDIELTIGTHGIFMYDLKKKTVTPLTEMINETISKEIVKNNESDAKTVNDVKKTKKTEKEIEKTEIVDKAAKAKKQITTNKITVRRKANG
ncbi:hypothetical protein FACS189459_4410 [Bacilli bacterium]|nr:hypothetical protein FACS189459_4410 [Bacilli bacterium]